MEEVTDENVSYFIPSDLMDDDGDGDKSEAMDIPSVANSKYFTFAPVRQHTHPTNPNTNGLISSRILPDGSNTFRVTTALGADFDIPARPSQAAVNRMMSQEYQEEYADVEKKPLILETGTVYLSWKE